MNEPLLFIRRVRRSLVPVVNPAPVPAICPHCGRSLTDPASVTLDPTSPAAPAAAEPEKNLKSKKSRDDAAKN